MPIQLISPGLILFEGLDTGADYSTWTITSFVTTYATIDSEAAGEIAENVPPNGGGSIYVSMTASPTDLSFASEANAHLYKTLNLGSGTGRRLHLYAGGIILSQALPATIYPFYVASKGDTIAGFTPSSGNVVFTLMSGTIPDALTGTQTCGICLVDANFAVGDNNVRGGECFVSHLVICLNDNLTVTGLVQGQLVKVYDAVTNALIGTGTASQTPGSNPATHEAVIPIGAVPFPELMYLQVYAADGVTLVDRTVSVTVSGGDVWNWTAPLPGIQVTSTAFVIYKQGSFGGSPPSVTITATLTEWSGAPYSGAALSFSTDLGILSATSVVTNSQGLASVTLTSPTPGFAVVTVTWVGASDLPASTLFVPVHIFAAAETPDPTKPFQVFIEGQEYQFTDGTYTLSADEVVGSFEVDIPAYLASIIPLGLVSIYRFGVKEFGGVLTRIERTLSDSPTVKLKGVDASWLLNTRAIDTAVFTAQTTPTILSSLLTNYPCGIVTGNLGSSATTLKLLFDTVQLLAAVKQVTAGVGWVYRVNPNLTLDYSNSFGVNTSAVFREATLGNQNLIASGSVLTEDVSLVQNSMHVKGKGITSLAQQAASILGVGLLEGSAIQSTITDQPTLNAIAQFDAGQNANAGTIIQLMVLDLYSTGTYHVYDYVTVTSPTLGLSGLYQVKQLTRSTLTNPYVTELQLGARVPEAWQLDESVKRLLNELAT